jgi:UDP-N-acetylmuramate--alanine ligase
VLLARYFKNIGKVSGYDKTPTALTKELIESGINIF